MTTLRQAFPGIAAPVPMLDRRERDLIKKLARRFESFQRPGLFGRGVGKAQGAAADALPENLTRSYKKVLETVSDSIVFKKTFDAASSLFATLPRNAAAFSISRGKMVELYRERGFSVWAFSHICAMRSYRIEKLARKNKLINLAAAFSEGAATGVPGILGMPFNVVLIYLLFFRAVQNIALHYGYEVRDDPNEMAFGASATMACLVPPESRGGPGLTGFILDMMLARDMEGLVNTLPETGRDYSERVQQHIRKLSEFAAASALADAGQAGLEQGILRHLIEQTLRLVARRAGVRLVPLIAAAVGAATDTYYMARVLKGANLIYHKRFLLEKEARVSRMLALE